MPSHVIQNFSYSEQTACLLHQPHARILYSFTVVIVLSVLRPCHHYHHPPLRTPLKVTYRCLETSQLVVSLVLDEGGENTQETAADRNVAGIEGRRRGWVRRHLRPVRENIVPPILITIDALYESADACPPLKSAVGGIRAIVNLCSV